MVTCVPGGRARSALATGPGRRFADVRWTAETGSTNADAMELARQGEPEGIVVVADHQTAGRGLPGAVPTASTGRLVVGHEDDPLGGTVAHEVHRVGVGRAGLLDPPHVDEARGRTAGEG